MTRYALTNAYDIKDSIKAEGGKWDAERKAWIISATTFAKFEARTQAYGMGWARGWAKVNAEIIVD